ncbi:hypothetical protein NVP1166O_29 [Vibrio phage 1.166.O._10N.261.51.C7]|nr:hypothetical protein NVP1166O_29 [Vibrio phage 1.166.O._10N.261.51.C7]AUR94053.1 hypothetical protein NVP1190O_29 [Vibrio phage 1.190.O._10N.286.51.F12]
MEITTNYTKAQLKLLINNPVVAQVAQMILCKLVDEANKGSKKPCASFWRQGENWITEEKLMESLELLLNVELIDSFSAGTLTVIVNVNLGE